MNLSMKWLADYVKVDVPIKDYCHALTMSGSKVECYEEEGKSISKVVVGKILSKAQHENADALFVCQVDIGADAPVQIVTNAKNVKEGDLVPVALDGAVLPEGKIKKCKMRGVESFGMFCGLDTLGLTAHDFPYADPEGVFVIEEDCELGQDIHSAIGLDDTSVEFEITSNRPDCLSVIGLARETAATYNLPLNVKAPEYKGVDGDVNELLKVDIINTEKCKRYCAGIVKNVKIGPSPRWMRERLRASGVRPINNFVDITNYVMLEYGQPMHAFDLRYVEGSHINVRNAKNGEKIMTLDGVERTLTEDMLVIADEKKPVAVAGVMGGEYSGIMDDTTTVVFESAYFEPTQVRRTSKALKLKSDASARYEKGVDPLISMTCLKRAFELVELLGAGEVLNTVIDCDHTDHKLSEVEFSPEWINNFLGTDISEADMKEYLGRLDFTFEGGKVVAPSFRIDIECKADIAEEVARIYGYNNIPCTLMRGETTRGGFSEQQLFDRALGETCRTLGYDEIITYSFISPSYYDKIRMPKDSPLRKSLKILNPLGEDTSIMRTTILPSMLEIITRNYNYRNKAVRLYELGKIYLPREDGLADEPKILSLGAYGDGMDFFTLKGGIEAILRACRIKDVRFEACTDNASYHPGRCAKVYAGDVELGVFGQIHPLVAATYGVDAEIYAAELRFDALYSVRGGIPVYRPLPKFPAVTRDIAVVCAESVTVGALEDCIRRGAKGLLKKVELFDIYRGIGVTSGSKSVAFSLTLRADDRSLTGEEADEDVKSILALLEAELGAKLR